MLSGADQLHLTAGYILYNYVYDEYKSWEILLERSNSTIKLWL